MVVRYGLWDGMKDQKQLREKKKSGRKHGRNSTVRCE